MGWVSTIGIALALAYELVKFFISKDAVVKRQRKEGIKEVIDGIETNDSSRVVAGFDKLRRMRK